MTRVEFRCPAGQQVSGKGEPQQAVYGDERPEGETVLPLHCPRGCSVAYHDVGGRHFVNGFCKDAAEDALDQAFGGKEFEEEI